MYSLVLLATISSPSPCLAQTGSTLAPERLVPIPQGQPRVQVAEKPFTRNGVPRDVVLVWNDVLLKAVKTERTPPPRAARNMAIVHAAIYDAVNAIEGTHRAYRVSTRPTGEASLEAAAAVAAHRTLVELYPRQVESFDTALDATLERVPEGPAKEAGMRLGQQVAEQILEWRTDDGSRRRVPFTTRPTPGLWRPTPPGRRAALLPQWRYLTPFAVADVSRFLPATPPVLTSAEYTEGWREVKDLGGRDSAKRTAEQTLIAWFWDDGEDTVTPPGHWNLIAQTVSRQRGLTVAENARLFALLNISMADAAILCWEGKFRFDYWRPITAIRDADDDDNPDTDAERDWDSLLTTPPFPSYPSGHSTFSGAAATALARFFGTDAVRFTIASEGLPGVTRRFPGFWAAAQEAGRSRIYGGIHYEFDNREGLRTGRELADHVARRFLLPLEDTMRTSSRRGPARRRAFSAGNADTPRLDPLRPSGSR